METQWPRFNPTMVIQKPMPGPLPATVIRISIPLWSFKNSRLLKTACSAATVSIPLWLFKNVFWRCFFKWLKFLSIPLWLFKNVLLQTRRASWWSPFNPTMVIQKPTCTFRSRCPKSVFQFHYGFQKRRSNSAMDHRRPCFNPTMVIQRSCRQVFLRFLLVRF